MFVSSSVQTSGVTSDSCFPSGLEKSEIIDSAPGTYSVFRIRLTLKYLNPLGSIIAFAA